MRERNLHAMAALPYPYTPPQPRDVPWGTHLLSRLAGLLARTAVPTPAPMGLALARLVVSTYADLCVIGYAAEGRSLLRLASACAAAAKELQ
jgi:hypothetical protein